MDQTWRVVLSYYIRFKKINGSVPMESIEMPVNTYAVKVMAKRLAIKQNFPLKWRLFSTLQIMLKLIERSTPELSSTPIGLLSKNELTSGL